MRVIIITRILSYVSSSTLNGEQTGIVMLDSQVGKIIECS